MWLARQRIALLLCLAASAVALVAAPVALPASYSWSSTRRRRRAPKASKGPGSRVWASSFGLAVLALVHAAGRRWGRWPILFHGTFGVAMVSVAAFSNKPWLPQIPYDAAEDGLHSVGATVMGFAFASGVLSRLIARPRGERVARVGDAVPIAAATVLPLGMSAWEEADGVLQRAMFVVAYLWFAREAWSATAVTGKGHDVIVRPISLS